MRQGASLARFPLRRLWRKTRNWEKYHRMRSSIRSSSSVGFRLPSGIAIGSLKSMKEPGHPLSRPRHLPAASRGPVWAGFHRLQIPLHAYRRREKRCCLGHETGTHRLVSVEPFFSGKTEPFLHKNGDFRSPKIRFFPFHRVSVDTGARRLVGP